MSKPTQAVCTECGTVNDDQPTYCPNCGAEEPWEEEYQYDMDDVEFPVIVSWEMYNDNYEMWRQFCYEVFGGPLKEEDIANMPSGFPRMKYMCPMLYFKVTRSSVEGPFLSEKEAKEA